ncbi:hypothetical protein BDV98DRAFT_563429 [Pterulicium gracile]|uniref:Uncharacterized protein n=1 Tax=Pterulicium gracile TaxID=1884261 RepID=A0A5C3QQ93_9AGAR|nr:hypothetical protein BDV98DRAFT_563429 [Pterula gracilis]
MTALLSIFEQVSRVCFWIYAFGALSFLSLETSAAEIRPQTGVGVEQCVSSQLDWYVRAMGETPCKTYATLRQIANDRYVVPKFPLITGPGDVCDGRDTRSCVNSVAFTLSMLCKSCQQCTDDDADCANADPSSLEAYINNVVPMTQVDNGGISAQLTTHVCNRRMTLPNFLWSPISPNVEWRYQDVKALASTTNSRSILADQCGAYFASVRAAASATSTPSTSVQMPSVTVINGPAPTVTADNSPTSGISPAPTPAAAAQASNASNINAVAVAIGSSVAAIVVLALVIGLLWVLIRRKRRQRYIEQHRVAISTYAHHNLSVSTSSNGSDPEKGRVRL